MFINGLPGFLQSLKNEGSFKLVLTSRLNQYCIENLFSIIRGKGAFRGNPVLCSSKTTSCLWWLTHFFVQSTASNCKVDNDQILLNLAYIAMAKYNVSRLTLVQKPMVMSTTPLAVPTENIVIYT